MAITLESFMRALSGQESGDSYTAQNGRTQAYGRYQIMPSNWPSWSREAGLPAGAEQTPENQERVARFKIQQYYQKFGNWEDVASAWYSGQPRSAYTPAQYQRKQGAGDEPSIQDYVESVVSRAGGEGGGMPGDEAPDIPSIIDALLAETVKQQPKMSDFKDDIYGTAADNYAAARSEWLGEIESLSKLSQSLKAEALGFHTLPDGTVLTTGELTPEQKAQIDTANQRQISATLHKYGLDDIDAKNKKSQSDFTNKITGINTGLAQEDNDLARAQADLGRWLDAQGVAQGDATNIQEARKVATQWGTSNGKTEFSANDLGSPFAQTAQMMNRDPAAPMLKYPGYQTFDPVGDRQRSLAGMGVNEAPPLIPPPVQRGPLPSAPALLPPPPLPASLQQSAPAQSSAPLPSSGGPLVAPPPGVVPPGIGAGTGPAPGGVPWLLPPELDPNSPNYIGPR